MLLNVNAFLSAQCPSGIWKCGPGVEENNQSRGIKLAVIHEEIKKYDIVYGPGALNFTI